MDSALQALERKRLLARLAVIVGGSDLSGSGTVFNPELVYYQDIGLGPTTSDWLEDVVHEINSLQVLEQIKNDAIEVGQFCARLPVEEPLIEVDEHGNVEMFFKSGSSGILLIVAATRNLQLFGNEDGEKWRAQYELL